MRQAVTARARITCVLLAALIGLILPTHTPASAGAAALGARAATAGAAGTASGGRHEPAPAAAGLSIAARVVKASGGRVATARSGCPATVALAVTVTYGQHTSWTRDTTLTYRPSRGIRVLNGLAPAKHNGHGHTTSRGHQRSDTSARIALPRPRHGHTSVMLKLALNAGPVQMRDRHGRRYQRIEAQIGGALQVARGRGTLAHGTLRLQVAVSCTPAKPRKPAGKPAPHKHPTTVTVAIVNFAFSPSSLTVVAGTTVKWTNHDNVPHTVTPLHASWGSGNLTKGASYSHTFNTPGTYNYICAIHPFMKGTLTVIAATPTPAAPYPSATAAGTAEAGTATATATPAIAPTQLPGVAAPTTTPTPAAPVPAVATVTIQNFAFSPSSLTIVAGATVKWTNLDSVGHTVTAQDGSWGSSLSSPLTQGATYSHTFTTPGTYTYFCAIHPNMIGTITVLAAPNATAGPAPTYTPYPTYTALPTYTPVPTSTPTFTPYPTYTPLATYTPYPTYTPASGPAGTATPTYLPGTPAPTATTPAVASPTATPATVTIQNFAFNPSSLTVVAGTTVIWTNLDPVTHTVTASDGSWSSGNLGQGATYSHTFTTPGTYNYFCAIHPFMTGTVQVTAPSATATSTPSSTSTATPLPSTTVIPSATPTSTPVPTGTGTPQSTATPTATSAPSGTPAPTHTPTATSTPPPAVATVTIQNFAFHPMTLTITAGTTVIWTNLDTVSHTVTDANGSWSSPPLGQGATYSRTFTTSGTVPYICAIHPFMKGTVIVTAASATATPTPAASATNTSVPSATPTRTPVPSATPTHTPPTATATATRTPVATPTKTPLPPTATNTPVGHASVTIYSFAFHPAKLAIAPGTKVTWTNKDPVTHTVTAIDGSWSSPFLGQGQTYTRVFTATGSYAYMCIIHPYMKGTITVSPTVSLPWLVPRIHRPVQRSDSRSRTPMPGGANVHRVALAAEYRRTPLRGPWASG